MAPRTDLERARRGSTGPGRTVLVWLASGVLMGTIGAACGTEQPVGSSSAPSGTLIVSAASSLTDVFDELTDSFEEQFDGIDVVTNFGSSARLADQVVAGAPADVVAFADVASMHRLTGPGIVDPEAESNVFATNELVIVTKPGNPLGIESPEDLGDLGAGGVVALCSPEAPCGIYAAEMLERAAVSVADGQVTRGQNASATLTAVTEGDAAAAVVYRTDALRAGDRVDVVELPPGLSPVADYVAAEVASTSNPDAAAAFVEHLRTPESRSVFERAGFGVPA